MTKALKQDATYADLYSVPDNFVAEILGGELYASPRPAYPHAFSASALGVYIGGPFQFGINGPGGWLVLDEPELRMADDVLVPRSRGVAPRATACALDGRISDARARLGLRGAVAFHGTDRSRQEARHLRARARSLRVARRAVAANARDLAARVGALVAARYALGRRARARRAVRCHRVRPRHALGGMTRARWPRARAAAGPPTRSRRDLRRSDESPPVRGSRNHFKYVQPPA